MVEKKEKEGETGKGNYIEGRLLCQNWLIASKSYFDYQFQVLVPSDSHKSKFKNNTFDLYI